MTKELKQHYIMTSYIPVHKKDMPPLDLKRTVRSLLFPTQNRDGRVKVCTEGDGSKQKTYSEYTNDKYVSPTCKNESVMIMAAIYSHKDRNVAPIN